MEATNIVTGQFSSDVKPTLLTQSIELGQLALALSKAQLVMGNAHKDSANPFFKSSYADLASCWDACRKPLADNDLAVIQTNEPAESGHITIVTRLVHKSGQFILSRLSIKLAKNDPQGVGSAITYGRRYELCAIVGISPADDDGNAATFGAKTTPKVRQKVAPKTKATVETKVETKVETEAIDDDF